MADLLVALVSLSFKQLKNRTFVQILELNTKKGRNWLKLEVMVFEDSWKNRRTKEKDKSSILLERYSLSTDTQDKDKLRILGTLQEYFKMLELYSKDILYS